MRLLTAKGLSGLAAVLWLEGAYARHVAIVRQVGGVPYSRAAWVESFEAAACDVFRLREDLAWFGLDDAHGFRGAP